MPCCVSAGDKGDPSIFSESTLSTCRKSSSTYPTSHGDITGSPLGRDAGSSFLHAHVALPLLPAPDQGSDIRLLSRQNWSPLPAFRVTHRRELSNFSKRTCTVFYSWEHFTLSQEADIPYHSPPTSCWVPSAQAEVQKQGTLGGGAVLRVSLGHTKGVNGGRKNRTAPLLGRLPAAPQVHCKA